MHTRARARCRSRPRETQFCPSSIKPRSHLEGMEGPVPAGGGGADREGFGGGARSVRPAAGVPWPETGRPPGRGDGGACLPRNYDAHRRLMMFRGSSLGGCKEAKTSTLARSFTMLVSLSTHASERVRMRARICTHTCTHARTQMRAHAKTRMQMHACRCTYPDACTHAEARMRAPRCTHARTQMHASSCTRARTHIHACRRMH